MQTNSERQSKNKQGEALTLEFQISREARERYKFNEALVSICGEDIKANMRGIRLLADYINRRRQVENKGAGTLHASYLYAAGLMDAIFHYIIGMYREEKSGTVFEELETFLEKKFGEEELKNLLALFSCNYPTLSVYKGNISSEAYLEGDSAGTPNRHIILEEIIILWLGNINPAFSPLIELVDDEALEKSTKYTDIMEGINAFFKTMPRFGPDDQHLIDLLRAPALKCPDSLLGQIDFILKRWGGLLGPVIKTLLLKGLDLIREEEKERDGFTPGETYVAEFTGDDDYERFSDDLEWMPKAVLMAKCTYVWLDQLSKQYKREINRLDQIPDEELDRLSSRGFTGLWLIGLWERSRASAKIKQMSGNPDAVASAYSLHDYDIACDLGGDEAYRNLRDRAWKRGIRLASDMVPNHMGLDSSWVVNNPDWFVQLDYPPFPSYSFSGADLCDDERVSIQIEDGYWHKTDASVVFKHCDHQSGRTRYIYHGNDGTQMPWNDTAQLNFLKKEVREAVIQTILHVARKFPIIRFDAAMTLAKRHYQRLWFPAPGSGGDIPSRAEHSISNEEFHNFFPLEFWREVVDRVKEEVPDTLLLAEAFWMMEGYFVRTLGMHRVYNSAFMNMLKNEENGKYRQSIKNVIEFNPQILKRYVNFMNNPDEETAVAQFGKDGKYFGITILMSTMPGLPMFGHGQLEGFAEKYGMEYRRAYQDEKPDGYLVARHEREIFPLLKKRYLFSEVDNFLLYDFYNNEGHVDEDVFAYSNGAGKERALVVYLNKFRSARGTVRISAGHLRGGKIIQTSLGEGLGLMGGEERYCIFRDSITSLEYIRSSDELCQGGLYVELEPFGYKVFLDFKEVSEEGYGNYGKVNNWLGGRGVRSIEDAMLEMELQEFIYAFHEAINPGSISYLARGLEDVSAVTEIANTFNEKMTLLLKGIKQFETGINIDKQTLSTLKTDYETLLRLPEHANKKTGWRGYIATDPCGVESGEHPGYRIMLIWLFTSAVYLAKKTAPGERRSFDWLFERHLSKAISDSLLGLKVYEKEARDETKLIRILIESADKLDFSESVSIHSQVEALLKSGEVQTFIDINMYKDELFFNKEKMETLIYWFFIITVFNEMKKKRGEKEFEKKISTVYKKVALINKAATGAGYKVEDFMEAL
ncbi:MAG: alpha-amylase family glycosyl hydrolase [bacterium]|nr:alpha-amylase family glycosyl hydrolase [bacterium]